MKSYYVNTKNEQIDSFINNDQNFKWISIFFCVPYYLFKDIHEKLRKNWQVKRYLFIMILFRKVKCLHFIHDILCFNSESRYLLLLVENYGALAILQQELLAINNVVVIFGSSFPSDQEYTQVWQNIYITPTCEAYLITWFKINT